MKPSPITIVESLKIKLMQFPKLVDSLQNKESSFLSNLENWMREIELIFKNNNISSVSEIAGLRSKIVAPLFSDSQNRSARKRQIQVASECLYDIQSTVLAIVNPYEIKIYEAREIVSQLLQILSQSGSLKFNNTDFQGFVNQIWTVFSTHEQLRPSTAKILTLIPQMDAVRLIAEEINLEDFSG